MQPGASATGLKRRFLAWNMVGSLVSRDELTHHTIDIEFADTTMGRPPSIKDHNNFELGTLDAHGALFAAKADGASPAVIMYRPFHAVFPNSDWSLQLPEGEEPLVVACARKWCAVATSKGYLRIFTAHGGLQKMIFSLPGPIVSMVGHGQRLVLVYHGVQPIKGQNLEMQLYDVEAEQVITQGKLALGEEARLSWLGFATTGMLCTTDSQGTLRGLAEKQDWQWVPLLDMVPLRKTKDDSHWIVGVTEEDVMCVLLKQGATEPHVQPRPLLESVGIQVPLLMGDDEFNTFERSMFRRKLAIEQEEIEASRTGLDSGVQEAQGKLMDRELLQMIHIAMKAEKEARAMEIGMMFNSAAAMQNAIKLAHVSHLQTLAERLTLIAQAKFAPKEALPSRKRQREVQFEDEAEEEEEEEEEVHEEEEAPMEEDGPLSRVQLSPVPPASRGSPVKRVRVEESPEEENPAGSSPVSAKQPERQEALQQGNPFGNPFAKKNVVVKAQPKSLSASLSAIAPTKTASQAGIGSKFGGLKAGTKGTKRPIGTKMGRSK